MNEKRQKLLSSKEYINGTNQFNLLKDIREYLAKNKMKPKDLAEKLNVTRSYVSQIMSGEFDHKQSKIVELYWHIGKAAIITPVDISDFVAEEIRKSDELMHEAPLQVTDNSQGLQFESKVVQLVPHFYKTPRNVLKSYTEASKEIAFK